MRIIVIFLLALAAALTAFAFLGGSGASRGGSRTRVVAAFYPLAYAARELGGPRVSVSNLTPAGAEPHDLELSPDDVRRIHEADVVLVLGHGFQPQVERAATQAQGRVVSLLDTPGLHRSADGDPHVWLDPVRYALLVRRIGSVLGREGAARALAARLRRLDRDYRAGLSRCGRRELVTSHAAFGYLAQRYGLKQVSIEGIVPDSEPTPRQLQRVASTVRRDHVGTVYFETLVSPKIARTLARETGAKTAVLDPLEGLEPAAIKRGADYFTVMRANLARLRQGLGCR